MIDPGDRVDVLLRFMDGNATEEELDKAGYEVIRTPMIRHASGLCEGPGMSVVEKRRHQTKERTYD